MIPEFLEMDARARDLQLHITLLGEPRLAIDKRSLEISSRKDQALLAYLATTPDHPHRRSHLAALLWSQSEDARARESLKQSLLRLRKTLPPDVLKTDRHTACLLSHRILVDVSQIEQRVASGSPESICMALDQCGDRFLQSLEDISPEFDNWRSERQRDLLETIRACALLALQQCASFGKLEQSEQLARRLVRQDPLDEEATRHLISTYAARGRQRAAQQAYQTLVQRLKDELGVAPEPATTQLIDSLARDSVSVAASGQAAVPRIAVLTFTVGAGESSQRFFAEGLTDDITTDLARHNALEVMPASTFAGVQGDISRLLLARGATHVLDGSVRRAEGRLRVNTRLIDTRDNQILWAQRFDRAMEDVFDMQDAIAAQIVSGLHLELSPDSAAVSGHGTRNPHAYDMFLKGRSLYLRGINNHSLRAAKALLDRSIELDPGFARAYAQLAICESYLAMAIVNKTGEDFSAQVLEHGREALNMNPELALGHAAVGLALYSAGRYQDAEEPLRRAIELDRHLFEAQFCLARNRRMQGDHQGAVECFRLAAALRPEDFRSSGLLGDSLKASGSDIDAQAEFQVAIRRIEAELEHHPDNAGALAFGAPILVDLNRIEQAREWSAWALAIEPGDRLSRYNLARLSALLGSTEQALEHLEVAFDAPLLVQRRLALWMRYDGDFKPLAGNRRFRRLLEYARARE